MVVKYLYFAICKCLNHKQAQAPTPDWIVCGQTLNLFSKPDIEITIDKKIFQETAEEVFIRYKSIKGFDHIEYDLPDIDEAINSLLSNVDKRLNTSFEELASEVETSEQAVAIFLALLEAIRWGFVKAEQVNNNELIKIEKNYEE